MATQHLLTTIDSHALQAHKNNKTHSMQPPSLQQVTAPVSPIKTPLLPTLQIHTDTSRTWGGEGGDWQTVRHEQTCTYSRQTSKHTLAALNNKHTQASTTNYSTCSQHKQTQLIITTVGCIGGWGGGGLHPQWQSSLSSLSFSRTAGWVPPSSGALAHGLIGWTSVLGWDSQDRSALCMEAAGSLPACLHCTAG